MVADRRRRHRIKNCTASRLLVDRGRVHAVSNAATYSAHLHSLQSGTEAALAAHGYDALILCGGVAASRNRFDDQSWPLSPTPAFAHWCPLVEADAIVV